MSDHTKNRHDFITLDGKMQEKTHKSGICGFSCRGLTPMLQWVTHIATEARMHKKPIKHLFYIFYTRFFTLMRTSLAVITVFSLASCTKTEAPATSAAFIMDTMVTQTAYGHNAKAAMAEVETMLAENEARLSLYNTESEIAAINAAAGKGGAVVSPETAALLAHTLELQPGTGGAFAVTIAPLTLAWGVTTNAPRIVPQAEIDRLLTLVNDAAVQVDGNRVTLPAAGMALDLGGVAKGAACGEAAEIYEANGVESALLSIGGNVYARGVKPDGAPWVVGFRNPAAGEGEAGYIASFPLTNSTIAVSGGYERYFEENGTRYIHILNPQTGRPAESDIASVGVVSEDGAFADMMSTALFVQGLGTALRQMENGLIAIVLDNDGNLYVSAQLEDGFQLKTEAAGDHTVTYIGGTETARQTEDGA